MKRKVVFIAILEGPCLWRSARVIPLNHPDTENVSNGSECITTPVMTINEDGSFETKNTHYVPLPKLDEEKEKERVVVDDARDRVFMIGGAR